MSTVVSMPISYSSVIWYSQFKFVFEMVVGRNYLQEPRTGHQAAFLDKPEKNSAAPGEKRP